MGMTPGTLAGFVEAFNTYLDAAVAGSAASWALAEAELIKAEVSLQTLPNTEKASWRGTLAMARTAFESARSRGQSATGTLIHAALRRKTRSQRDDGT